MSLTFGAGPLATEPAELNFEIDAPRHRLFFQEYPRRIRALLDGHTVLDTARGRLLHESNLLPRFYFPIADLDRDMLVESDHTTHCPFKGDATYWHLRVGDRLEENAVWRYEQPIGPATWLGGYASLYARNADTWLVEEDEFGGEFRDPYHRVDVHSSARRVTVRAGDHVVAETERPKLLFETNVPARAYLPRTELTVALEPSETTAVCPYKGTSNYWHIRAAGGELIEDAAWTYEQPLAEAAAVAGHVAFDPEKLTVEVAA